MRRRRRRDRSAPGRRGSCRSVAARRRQGRRPAHGPVIDHLAVADVAQRRRPGCANGGQVEGVHLARAAGRRTPTRERDQHAEAARARASPRRRWRRRRLRGPSVSATSAARWAPVRTTGVGRRARGRAGYAVSSMVSVPWVTTMPSTSSRREQLGDRVADLAEVVEAHLVRPDPQTSSCASTRRSSTASSSGPPRVVASSVATTAPPGARRDEMVPPVVSRTTRGTEPPIGRAGCSRGSSVKHGARRPGQWPCGWSRPPSGSASYDVRGGPRRGCRPPRTRSAAAPPPLAARADRGPSTAVRRSAAPAGATAGTGTAAQHPDRHGPQPRWGRPARASAHALVWVLTPRTRWTRRRDRADGACTGAPTQDVGRHPSRWAAGLLKVESEPHPTAPEVTANDRGRRTPAEDAALRAGRLRPRGGA